MLKHGDFSPQDDHRDDQPDRDGRPDDAEYPDVDRVVGRAEFAGGPFEETHALAENEVDHSIFSLRYGDDVLGICWVFFACVL